MSNGPRARLSYANVMSTLAFLLAVGGGAAYAANTVFSTDIVNGEVKTVDIADNGVRAIDIAGGNVGTSEVANDSLTGNDVAEPTLQGVNAATLDALDSTDFFIPEAGHRATATEDNFSVGECSSGCFTFLDNPTNGPNFLDSALKLESCSDGGMMLNYENQSSGTQLIRQVRYNETGSAVTRTTFGPGSENNFFLTSPDEMRRIEMYVQGAGIGEVTYDVYTEHEDAADPSFSDTCSAAGSAISVYGG
jgi:hypothetical protein